MASLSLTPTPKLPATAHLRQRRHQHHRLPTSLKPISASSGRLPRLLTQQSPAPAGEVYQPFRPPPSPLPAQYRSLGPLERLDVLRNRLGQWHEYAPLISYLITQDGFTPPSIEEVTGISGVQQSRLVVASQVRDSLVSSSLDPSVVAYFDFAGGADLLYELRLLNASQRAAAAASVAELGLNSRAAQEVARAVKDFPHRRGDEGWECFTANRPGDCLAYTHFRLSREAIAVEDRIPALERALDAAETEAAKARIAAEIEKVTNKGEAVESIEIVAKAMIPVVRLKYGEVAEASSVALLPVVDAREGEEGLEKVPKWCKAEGEMGVVAAEKGWSKWVALPGWGPVKGIVETGGVAVAFGDARALPWSSKRWEKEEPVLVVADRGRREVAEEHECYLVAGRDGEGLAVEKGRTLVEKGLEVALGTVVVVVRPPKEEEENQLSEKDWE